jgi:hypothetical protein
LKGYCPDDTGKAANDEVIINQAVTNDSVKNIKGGCADITVNNPKGYQ